MPIRYPCPAVEAGEECENALCVHAIEQDGSTSTYLFGNVTALMAFHISPEMLQQAFCLLMDMEYDENTFVV
jgi:hypothetical protein